MHFAASSDTHAWIGDPTQPFEKLLPCWDLYTSTRSRAPTSTRTFLLAGLIDAVVNTLVRESRGNRNRPCYTVPRVTLVPRSSTAAVIVNPPATSGDGDRCRTLDFNTIVRHVHTSFSVGTQWWIHPTKVTGSSAGVKSAVIEIVTRNR